MKANELPEELWNEILKKIKELVDKHHRPSSEILLDDVDFRNLLKVSRRTALEYRKSGLLLYYKIENKIYYFLADVISFIKKAGKPNE
ncbi:MAG: helix-turn-helix domain-containing protein [Chitinophagaceae bacterium]|nr:helix-turn-helix domain-containing protein [Chitinophagaceae bacterium]